MRFSLHPAAEEELTEAVRYYEECQAGLGLEFAEEIHATIVRIVQFPDAWSRMSANTRRCLVNRFPYGVIYQVTSDLVRIISIANLHRRPGYWKGRV